MQQRRSTPFGTARGSRPTSWPGSKGFVGGTQDKGTGLTHLGARDHDPSTGRFISADPLLVISDPQQTNGYSYSSNSPVTHSDPTGLRTDCGPSSREGASCPRNDQNADGLPDDGRQTGKKKDRQPTTSSPTLTEEQKKQLKKTYEGSPSSTSATPRRNWIPTRKCSRLRNEDLVQLGRD